MAKLDYVQAMEIVEGLDNDFERVRTRAQGRYDLYRMQREAYVPEEIAREGKLQVRSPMIMYAAETVRADLMMNPTEFTAIPLARDSDGTIPKRLEAQAENLERALAVVWGRLNEGRRIDREVIWHQLVSPFGIMILEFHPFVMPEQPSYMSDEAYLELVDEAERNWMPWGIYLPDPMTCSWIERDGKPVVFVRRYKMLVRDVERLYSLNGQTPHPDERLRLDGGYFKWCGDDYSRDTSQYKGGFKEISMVWMDDGEYIYTLIENPEGGSGEIVWCQPNPVNRCTAFIVPGNTTPAREPENRYEPFLLPLMQVTDQLNNMRSMRATAARNLAGPHTYIAIDPEVAKLYITRGEKLPTSVRWKKNETHYLLGKVEVMPSELSPDWDKVEQAITEEAILVRPSQFVNTTDPTVLKAATATSILHAAEAGLRMYGPLMSSYDAAIRDICDAIVYSMRNYYTDENIYAFATGEEMSRGVSLKQGTVYRLNTKAVSFQFKLLVKSRAMSQAQAAAQFDLVLRQWVLPDGSKGPATFDDVIDAANYTDRTAQRMKLATEAILNAIDPWIQQEAIQIAAKKIYLDSGIQIPLAGQQGAMGTAPVGGVPPTTAETAGGGSAPTPARVPNAAQRMETPLIQGQSGGSESTTLGG